VFTTVTPFADAETFTVVLVWTGMLVNVNVVLVDPAGIVTVAGTVPAAGVSEDRLTGNPPTGALLLIVTVPVEGVPPMTDVGFITTVASVGAVIASGALADVPSAEPEMLAVTFDGTITVVTVKVAELEPAGMVTVAGTVAAALSDARLTV
jgi:hypothetical protein